MQITDTLQIESADVCGQDVTLQSLQGHGNVFPAASAVSVQVNPQDHGHTGTTKSFSLKNASLSAMPMRDSYGDSYECLGSRSNLPLVSASICTHTSVRV